MTEQEMKDRIAANPTGPLLALVPESRAVQRKMHMTGFKPGLGASKVACELCGQRSWIGLKQKQYKDEHPDTPAVCFACAVKHGANLAKGNVKHLGGYSHQYELDGVPFDPDHSKN
jgi:hypothetical protein